MAKINLLSGDSYEDKKSKAALEKWLEDAIEKNFGQIFEDRYELLARQYDTKDAGIMDLLAVEKQSGDIVSIELKKDRGADVVIGQVSRYMGWIQIHTGKLKAEFKQLQDSKRHDNARGMIICGRAGTNLVYAAAVHDNVKIYCYRCDPVTNSFMLGPMMILENQVSLAAGLVTDEGSSPDNTPGYMKLLQNNQEAKKEKREKTAIAE